MSTKLREPDTSVRKLWRTGSVLDGRESPYPDRYKWNGRPRNEEAHSSQRPYFSKYVHWQSLRHKSLPVLAGTHALPSNATHLRAASMVALEGYSNACWSGALVRAEPCHLPNRAERAKERALLRVAMPVLQPHVDALRAFGEQHGGVAVAEWEARTGNCFAERDRCLEQKQVVQSEIIAVEEKQASVDSTLKTVRDAATERSAAFEAAAQARAHVAELRAEVDTLRMIAAAPGADALPVSAEDLESRRASAQAQRQRLAQLLQQFEFEAQRRCLRALGETIGEPIEPLPTLIGASYADRRPSRDGIQEGLAHGNSQRPSLDPT